jgi:hypothetical protein
MNYLIDSSLTLITEIEGGGLNYRIIIMAQGINSRSLWYRKTPLNLPWATKTLKPIISKTKKDNLIRLYYFNTNQKLELK